MKPAIKETFKREIFKTLGVGLCVLVWFGLVWFSLVWFGLVWCFETGSLYVSLAQHNLHYVDHTGLEITDID